MRDSISFKAFVEQLDASGILSASEVERFCSSQRALPDSGDALVRALVRANKITGFQARVVGAGHGRLLRLGNYVILRKIGRGGMGSVYQAKHTRMDRIVAIKVISPRLLKNVEAADQFDQETRTAARLIHPNIVAAYDAGVEGDLRYLVMEYVDGPDLGLRIDRQGPLSVSLAVRFLRQAALGLQHAHGQGVVHRDVKPGNLLVGSDGVVKLSDLGMVRLLGEQWTRERAASRRGVILGTLDFMAPEQAMSFSDADERSDVYGLGCTLYYLLVGRCVYPGLTPTDRLLAHREHPIPSLRDRCPEATIELERVFQRMVAKRPVDRFQTMEGVLEALDGLATPVATGPHPGVVDPSIASDSELRSFLQGIETSDYRDSRYETHHWDSHVTKRTVVPPTRRRTKGRFQVAALLTAELMLAPLLLGVIIAATSSMSVNRERGKAAASKISEPSAGRLVNERLGTGGLGTGGLGTGERGSSVVNVDADSDRRLAPVTANYGLLFDGESAYATAPTLQFDGRPPLTLEASVWVESSPSESVRVIAGWGQVAVLTVSSAGDVYGLSTFFPDGRPASIYSERGATRVHLAGVWDGRHLSLYLDGKRQETALVHSIRGTSATGHPVYFSLGGWCENPSDKSLSGKPQRDACSYFRGILDEVRVSRAVRYQGDFRPAARFDCDADTLALYHADEGAGDTLRDCSGNQHHAKIHGANWTRIPAGR